MDWSGLWLLHDRNGSRSKWRPLTPRNQLMQAMYNVNTRPRYKCAAWIQDEELNYIAIGMFRVVILYILNIWCWYNQNFDNHIAQQCVARMPCQVWAHFWSRIHKVFVNYCCQTLSMTYVLAERVASMSALRFVYDFPLIDHALAHINWSTRYPRTDRAVNHLHNTVST